MKNIVSIFLVLVLVASCSKDDNVTSKVVEIKINLSNTSDYVYGLGTYAEGDIVEIVSQATHFEISELFINDSTGYTFYKYKPQAGYAGEDFVEINSEKRVDTVNDNIEIKTVRLSFNILD